MIASVIIPTYNRQILTERAINSVLKCNGSTLTQIIVVDDCSVIPFKSPLLRTQDMLIRQEINCGANVCRSVGLKNAVGEVIYFLDSDDYILNRNFEEDYEIVKKNPNFLYYCNYNYGFGIKNIPDTINKDNYFDYILNRYPGLANTCSICFSSNLNIVLDTSLKAHQDWDFIYFSFLKKGITAKKLNGYVFIDRTDKKSISRQRDPNRSLPWLEKLRKEDTEENYNYLFFYLLSKYPECMSFFKFLNLSLSYLIKNKTNLRFVLKRFIQRFL